MYWELSNVSLAAKAAALFCVISAIAAGQGSGIQGHIQGDGARLDTLEIQLRSLDGGNYARAPVMADGSFFVGSLDSGEYELSVLDSRGGVLHREVVAVNGRWTDLLVRLPSRRQESPVAGAVSAGELSRKIPGAALKEGRQSDKAIAKGDLEKAIAHLRKAIEIFPDFAAAHNNLGLCFSRLKQRQAALDEFETAARLDSGSALYSLNYSSELLQLGKYDEAERPARHALQLDPASDAAHYLLGVSLTAQKRANEEALRQLGIAAKHIPEALLFAADVLTRAGRRAEAIMDLRRYLDLPGSTSGQATARQWLDLLEQAK